MFPTLIEKLKRQEDLTTEEAAAAMAVIMRGEAAPAQIAGLLIGLSIKGERPSELVGFAQTMRENALKITARGTLFDTCGTGGDRAGTFNISTAAAIVLAACGMKIGYHVRLRIEWDSLIPLDSGQDAVAISHPPSV